MDAAGYLKPLNIHLHLVVVLSSSSVGIHRLMANLLLCKSGLWFFTFFQCLLLQDLSALDLWPSASTCDSPPPPPLMYDDVEDTTTAAVCSAAPAANGPSPSLNGANMKEHVWDIFWVNYSFITDTTLNHIPICSQIPWLSAAHIL